VLNDEYYCGFGCDSGKARVAGLPGRVTKVSRREGGIVNTEAEKHLTWESPVWVAPDGEVYEAFWSWLEHEHGPPPPDPSLVAAVESVVRRELRHMQSAKPATLTDVLAEALAGPIAERLSTATPGSGSAPRYYSAATAPIEHRAWDRAVKEIPAFKPGRELLVRADDLHAWIERQGHKGREKPADPLDYESFAAPVRRRNARKRT